MARGNGGAPWLAPVLALVWLSSPLLSASSGSPGLVPVTPAVGANDSRVTEEAPRQGEEALEEADGPRNSTAMLCDDARLRCAYRTGCGRALQTYLQHCASVIHGDSNDCPEACQYALIALTSTDEGKELMTCQCAKDDLMCRQTKQRAEVCRSSVTATMNRTRLSCRVATWICNADALCSTALQYYNENCKRMFHGKKCTKRCLNSINILRRQEKAAKLNTCSCDGAKDYDCIAIHRNMDALCFNKPAQHHKYRERGAGSQGEPSAKSAAGGGAGGFGPGSGSGDTRASKLPTSGARAARLDVSASWSILLLGPVLLLHGRLLSRSTTIRE